jgi:hypothetical protein
MAQRKPDKHDDAEKLRRHRALLACQAIELVQTPQGRARFKQRRIDAGMPEVGPPSGQRCRCKGCVERFGP